MLQIRDVTRRFGKNTAVDGVALEIPAGPDGRHHRPLRRRQVDPAAHDQPADRSQRWGRSVSTARRSRRCAGAALRAWQRDCAMIFQQFNLVPRLDVLTNVMLGRLNHRSTVAQPAQHLLPRRARSWRIAALERLDIAQTALQRRRHAVGRPAAARRHRPRADAAAQGDPRRRADRLARPAQCPDRHGCAARHQPARRASPSSPTCTRSTPPAPIATASSAWRPAGSCSTARPTN